MPGRFVEASEVKEIRAEWWDPDESVTIKRFSYGDRQFFMGEILSDGARLKGRDVSVDISVGRMNLAVLERGVVRWTLKRADGSVAPLTPAQIAQLAEKDAEFILSELQRFNPTQDEEAKNS